MFTRYALSVNMAFGQTRPIAHDSWGDAQATVINGRWPMLDCKVSIFKERERGRSCDPGHSSLTLRVGIGTMARRKSNAIIRIDANE